MDGTEFPVEIRMSLLHAEEGLYVISAIREVTQRRHLEQELHKVKTELGRALSAEENFFDKMSHELRSPLNAIIGFTSTLLMELPGPLNEDQKEQLETVEQSANHLLSLIDDLLKNR
jgi:protein-histidine pros-kinase